MQVEYDLTAADLAAFHWRAQYESAAARRMRWLGIGGLFAILATLSIVPAMTTEGFQMTWIAWIPVTVVFPIVAVLHWIWFRWVLRRVIAKLIRREQPEKGQLGRHRVVLSDEGVIESTAVGESRTTWAGIDRVEESDDYIFIYTSPSAAHVIPKRAFSGPEAATFFQEARRRAGSARTFSS
jgi:hypothetical protein